MVMNKNYNHSKILAKIKNKIIILSKKNIRILTRKTITKIQK